MFAFEFKKSIVSCWFWVVDVAFRTILNDRVVRNIIKRIVRRVSFSCLFMDC